MHKYTSLGSREQPLPCVVAVATHTLYHPLLTLQSIVEHLRAWLDLPTQIVASGLPHVQTSNSWSWCIDVHDDGARVVKLLVGQLSVKDPSKSQSLTMPIPQECVTLGSYRIRCNLVGCCWRQSKLYVFPLIGH